MALGAQPQNMLALVLGRGVGLALTGIAAGVFGALALTRFLSSLLFGVRPTDPLTFAAVAALLLMVALAACYIPARRAMKVDPMVAPALRIGKSRRQTILRPGPRGVQPGSHSQEWLCHIDNPSCFLIKQT